MTVKRFIARPASHSRYESLLARLAKFAYLNRLDHRDIDLLLADSAVSQRVPKATTKSVAITLMLQADAQGAKIAARLAEMLEINQDDVPRMLTKTFCIWEHEDEREHRHCPECDKTGFHTAIFDLPCLMQCPMHGVDLTDKCPVCEKDSNHDCSVTRLGTPFECRKGHVLWPTRNSRIWPKSVTPKQEDVLDGVMSFLEITRDLVHFTDALNTHRGKSEASALLRIMYNSQHNETL